MIPGVSKWRQFRRSEGQFCCLALRRDTVRPVQGIWLAALRVPLQKLQGDPGARTFDIPWGSVQGVALGGQSAARPCM